MNTSLGIIAGNGHYPLILARAARKQGVSTIVAVAFHGETSQEIESLADEVTWLRVGQLGAMISFFSKRGVSRAIMAGQIAPKNLFSLRPDLKALLILAKLRERNAESIFGAIAVEMSKAGIELLPATTHLEDCLATPGLIAGPALSRGAKSDVALGFRMAKEIARLDIGQCVVVKKGTVLAVEGFDGTDATIRRGGALGHGDSVFVKVSKPNQDFRFDVPVIGTHTLRAAHESGISVMACEAGKTLLLDKDGLRELAAQLKLSLFALDPSDGTSPNPT